MFHREERPPGRKMAWWLLSGLVTRPLWPPCTTSPFSLRWFCPLSLLRPCGFPPALPQLPERQPAIPGKAFITPLPPSGSTAFLRSPEPKKSGRWGPPSRSWSPRGWAELRRPRCPPGGSLPTRQLLAPLASSHSFFSALLSASSYLFSFYPKASVFTRHSVASHLNPFMTAAWPASSPSAGHQNWVSANAIFSSHPGSPADTPAGRHPCRPPPLRGPHSLHLAPGVPRPPQPQYAGPASRCALPSVHPHSASRHRQGCHPQSSLEVPLYFFAQSSSFGA